MKTFILLSAIAGSGKSFWAETYAKSHKNTYIVSSDNLRFEIGGAYQNFEHEDEMWERFRSDILKFKDEFDDVNVIADATNITNNIRLFYADFARDFDKKILVVIKRNKQTVLKQNSERGKGKIVPLPAINMMLRKWEDPNEEVISKYDEVLLVEDSKETYIKK